MKIPAFEQQERRGRRERAFGRVVAAAGAVVATTTALFEVVQGTGTDLHAMVASGSETGSHVEMGSVAAFATSVAVIGAGALIHHHGERNMVDAVGTVDAKFDQILLEDFSK